MYIIPSSLEPAKRLRHCDNGIVIANPPKAGEAISFAEIASSPAAPRNDDESYTLRKTGYMNKPMLITFSGLDGAGKTTQLNLFTQYLRENNHNFKRLRMYEDVSTSAFMRKFFRKKAKEVTMSRNTEKPYRYDKNRKGVSLVFLRKLTYIIDLLVFLVRRFYYQRIKKSLIIMDRYLYDSLANLFNTQSEIYTKLMLKVVPQPDLAIFLDVAPKVAFSRKPEYPPEFYPERREAYLNIFSKLQNGHILRSSDISATHNEVKQIFKNIGMGSRVRSDKYSRYMDFIMSSLLGDSKAAGTFADFEFHQLVDVLRKNRILVRWFNKARSNFNNTYQADIDSILKERTSKMNKALDIIGKVTEEFDKRNLPLLVIKTLDNYPDLGHDIDMYTNAPIQQVDEIMTNTFDAQLKPPTLADRIAQKRNYKIAGYTTLEIHCSKLGELGEDNLLAQDLIHNKVKVNIDGRAAYVPKPEYRLLLCILQRMYRHFNIRICDIYNTISLIKSNQLDWECLRSISLKYGMWKGVSLYLSYIQRFVRYYGVNLNIEKHLKTQNWPASIADKNMHFRFPLLTTGINIYSRKLFSEIINFNIYALCRITLIVPFSLLHFMSVKMFGRSRIW